MLFEKIQLEDGEKIELLVRKHWFVVLVDILWVTFTASLPFIVLILIDNVLSLQTHPLDQFGLSTSNWIFLSAWWLLLQWLTLSYLLTDYYLDLFVLTNERIITINQKGFFNREIGSFRLEKLQDMQVAINGLIPTFLDFGTVEAETASGSAGEFRVHQLPKPREIKAAILKAADKRITQK